MPTGVNDPTITWSADGGNTWLTANGKFQAGITYQTKYVYKAKTGYVFDSENINVNVSGNNTEELHRSEANKTLTVIVTWYPTLKLEATTAMSTVSTKVSKDGVTGATVDLPALPDGATFGTAVPSGTITMKDMSIKGNTLTYTALQSEVAQTGMITIPVTGATNYNDYDITVTVTSSGKAQIKINIAGVSDKVYDGQEMKATITTVKNDGSAEE